MIRETAPDESAAVGDVGMQQCAGVFDSAHRKHVALCRDAGLLAVRSPHQRLIDSVSRRCHAHQSGVQHAVDVFRFIQFLPVPASETSRRTEQQRLHLKNVDGVVQEPAVAEVLRKRLEAKPAMLHFADIHGVA